MLPQSSSCFLVVCVPKVKSGKWSAGGSSKSFLYGFFQRKCVSAYDVSVHYKGASIIALQSCSTKSKTQSRFSQRRTHNRSPPSNTLRPPVVDKKLLLFRRRTFADQDKRAHRS
eukprot:2536714-Rhodomonas_salina.1